MSDLECSSFRLQQLGNFPHFFSDEERDALNKWGAHAAGLTDGSIEPGTAKEGQFADVARGTRPPATRFQRVWLRYLQAVDIETKWRESERKLILATSLLSAANVQIEQLKEDVVRLTKLWKLAGQHAASEPMRNAEHTNEGNQAEEPDQKPVPAATQAMMIGAADEVTNRTEYLCFVDAGLSALSDNQVFALFNIVDRIGLTSQELQNFAVEHQIRKARYQSDWARDNGFVVYANTDGQ